MIDMLGLALAAAAMADGHSVSVPHARGPIAATYRSTTAIRYQQQGAATPPGVAPTLRCHWSATAQVSRTAIDASGTRMHRDWSPSSILTGVRPGSCEHARQAIAVEVAARQDAIARHRHALAARDRAMLIAEVEGVVRGSGG